MKMVVDMFAKEQVERVEQLAVTVSKGISRPAGGLHGMGGAVEALYEFKGIDICLSPWLIFRIMLRIIKPLKMRTPKLGRKHICSHT